MTITPTTPTHFAVDVQERMTQLRLNARLEGRTPLVGRLLDHVVLEAAVTEHHNAQHQTKSRGGVVTKYLSLGGMLLDLGEAQEGPLTLPPSVGIGEMNMCFANCTRVVVDRDQEFLYTEGLAMTERSMFPTPHAWLTRISDGVVVDPTWSRFSEWGNAAYLGIKFSTEMVEARMFETEYFGLLCCDYAVDDRGMTHGFTMEDGIAVAEGPTWNGS